MIRGKAEEKKHNTRGNLGKNQVHNGNFKGQTRTINEKSRTHDMTKGETKKTHMKMNNTYGKL